MKKGITVQVDLKLDAYAIMETEFEGMPSRNEIISNIRMLLTLHKLQETEKNLDLIGTFLVVLKKEHGIAEMNIIKHMITHISPGVTLKMQAVISAVYLKTYGSSRNL